MQPPNVIRAMRGEMFIIELWITRAYILAADPDELACQLAWIQACTGMDDYHFAHVHHKGRWGATQLLDTGGDPATFAQEIGEKISEMERELVSA